MAPIEPHANPLFAKNRKEYLAAKKNNWRPLENRSDKLKGEKIQTEAWELSLVSKTLKITLENGVGDQRKKEGSRNAIQRIVPIVSNELKSAKLQVSADDNAAFAQIMDFISKNPEPFAKGDVGAIGKLKELAKNISPKGFSECQQFIHKIGWRFIFENKERWNYQNRPIFEQMADVQIRHDIFFAFDEIENLFEFLKKGTP